MQNYDSEVKEIKNEKIFGDFLQITYELLQIFYEYFSLATKLQHKQNNFTQNDRISVYLSSSSVLVTVPDENENEEFSKKIQEIQNQSIKNTKKSSIRFYSPDFKENSTEKVLQKTKNQSLKRGEKEEINLAENNSKNNLKKNILDLKSKISKLIWKESRRVYQFNFLL